MGISVRCSCRGLFKKKKKKTDVLPVPWEYTVSLMMFTINNLDNLQANSVVQRMSTGAKHQLHRPTVNLPCIQKGIFYASIKKESYCSYVLFSTLATIHQSNCLSSSTSVMSPTTIINDSS